MNEAESRAIEVMFITCSSAVLTHPKFKTHRRSLSPLYEGMRPHEDEAPLQPVLEDEEAEETFFTGHGAYRFCTSHGCGVVGHNRRSHPWTHTLEEAASTAYRKAPPRTSGTGRGRVAALLPWKENTNIDTMKTAATLISTSVLISQKKRTRLWRALRRKPLVIKSRSDTIIVEAIKINTAPGLNEREKLSLCEWRRMTNLPLPHHYCFPPAWGFLLKVLASFFFLSWCNSLFYSPEHQDASYFPVKGQKKKALF